MPLVGLLNVKNDWLNTEQGYVLKQQSEMGEVPPDIIMMSYQVL
jgi:hypothetical protein